MMASRAIRSAFRTHRRLFATAAAPQSLALESQGNFECEDHDAPRKDTLVRRLLGLVYARRSAVEGITKWMEEGHKVQKHQLSRIIRELRKNKRFQHALEICEWRKEQKELKLHPGDYAVHMDLVAKVRGFQCAEKFFEDLPEKMKGRETHTTLLHVYSQNKMVDEAEALLKRMSDLGILTNSLPYNHMIVLYSSTGRTDKLPDVIRELKKNATPDLITYNLLLSAFSSISDIKGAEKVFVEMSKRKIDPDWITYATMANIYIKNKQIEKASSALELMETSATRKNRAAYSSLMTLYTNIGDPDGVKRVWKEMKSNYRKLNNAEYSCMISCLLKLQAYEQAEIIYEEWESVTGMLDSRIPNLMLDSYVNRGEIKEVEKFHMGMTKKGVRSNYHTWELLTYGSLKSGRISEALENTKNAINCVKNWDFDEKLVGEVAKKIEELGDIESAEKLVALVAKAGHKSTRMYNFLWRTYEKAGRMPLIVSERMKIDNVELDEETRRLIRSTSKLCVSEP